METMLTTRFTTLRRIAIDETFPFYDLPAFLKSLSPTKINICFYKSVQQGSIIYLTLSFPKDVLIDSIALFKETLIRSEMELDVDCQFIDGKISTYDNIEWVSGEIQPEAMELPSGKKIAVTITLLDIAVDLFRQANYTQSDFCYIVSLEWSPPDPINARELVPSLAELQGKRSAPAGLEDAVRLSFDLLRSGGWTSHERICIPKYLSALHRSRIENLVREHLNKSVRFIPNQLLNFQWNDYYESDIFENTLQNKVVRLRTQNFIEQLFQRLLPSVPNSSVIIKSLEETRRLHGSQCVDGDYAFISYAHTNNGFVKLLLRELNAEGVRYWYDTRIPTGSCWDEELENKIRKAGAFIACVSDAYQDSRYCRRELKFADLIGKSILPVTPTKWTWGAGLQMMFQEIQISSICERDGLGSFCRTLQTVAPQVFSA